VSELRHWRFALLASSFDISEYFSEILAQIIPALEAKKKFPISHVELIVHKRLIDLL